MTATPAAAAQQLPVQCPSVPPGPRQQKEENEARTKRIVKWVLVFVIVCYVVAVIAIGVYLDWRGKDQGKRPRYHVVVDAVTGLDPATDLAWPTLSPEFNFTVGIASRSVTRGWCLEEGSRLRVSYHGIELAGGPLPRFCVGPRQSGEQGSVVAWGDAVPVPQMIRDTLASELRRGAAEFSVKFNVKPDEDYPLELSCMVAPPALPHRESNADDAPPPWNS